MVIAHGRDLAPLSYYVFRGTGRFERYRMIKSSFTDTDFETLRSLAPRPQTVYVIEDDKRTAMTAAEAALDRLDYTRVDTHELPSSRVLRYELER